METIIINELLLKDGVKYFDIDKTEFRSKLWKLELIKTKEISFINIVYPLGYYDIIHLSDKLSWVTGNYFILEDAYKDYCKIKLG